MPPAKRACAGLDAGSCQGSCHARGECSLEGVWLLDEMRTCSCGSILLTLDPCPLCRELDKRVEVLLDPARYRRRKR